MKRATKDITVTNEQTKISIHALVKRATWFAMTSKIDSVISIHALVKRATLPEAVNPITLRFQSTPS